MVRLRHCVYDAQATETRFIRSLFSDIVSRPLAFGERVLAVALEPYNKTHVDPTESKFTMMGFHAKALDQLTAIRILTEIGSFGPAAGECRTLFETFLYVNHILSEDTERRIKEYRASYFAEQIKAVEQVIKKGDTSHRTAEILAIYRKAFQVLSATGVVRRKWTGKDLAQLADTLGFGVLYAGLYRTACTVTHAGDADGYNPIMPYLLRAKETLEQPFFVSSYGLWALTDVMSLLTFLFLIPFRLFAQIAEFLGVNLDQAEREHLNLLLETSRTLTPTMSMDDLAKAFPSFLEVSRE